MNQNSAIGFGTDATVLAGYAVAANDRLGPIDFVVENTGENTLTLFLREYDGTTSPSGWAQIGAGHTVVAKGVKTISTVLLSKTVGFFGSGATSANISSVLRNKANLRGAQVDIVQSGRKGWGFDDGFNKDAFRSPGWPAL